MDRLHGSDEPRGPFDVSVEQLKLWRQVPLKPEWGDGCECPGISPVSFVSAIDLRNELRQEWPEYETTLADIHVLARGEPENRAATKFGGLPFRPAGAAWPVTSAGDPYSFVCQFRFVESKDLLPPLPGDLLLVFLKGVDLYTGDPEFIHFEWQPATLTNLMTASELRGEPWPYIHAYGLRYRSFDFVEFEEVAKRYLERSSAGPNEGSVPDVLVRRSATWAARLNGLKIGGRPCWRDERPDDAPPDNEFLCGFTDMFSSSEIEWPWANVQQPRPLGHWPTNEYLNWFDGFDLHFFLRDNQQIEWIFEIG